MTRPHGSYVKYVTEKCRCDQCRAAIRAYERERGRRPTPAYVDAARARAHVEELRQSGVGLKSIAKASGVSHGALSKLVYGSTRRGPSDRIRPTTETKILGVTVRDGQPDTRIPSGSTEDVIRELLARGWTKAGINRTIGLTGPGLQIGGTRTVATRNAKAIAALLDQPVPPKHTRWGPRPVPQPDTVPTARAKELNQRHRSIKPVGLEQPGEWINRARCRRDDCPTWLLFPAASDNETIRAAQQICAVCPVRNECLDYALRTDAEGIWGGLNEAARRDLVHPERFAS